MQIKPIVFLFFFLNFSISGITQTTFYQDVCNCGVTGAGFSVGQGIGEGNLEVFIEPNSTIKKVFAFTYSQRDINQETFTFNGTNLIFSEQNVISSVDYAPPWPFASPSKLYVKEITNLVTNNQNSYNIILPDNFYNQINKGFWSFYLLIIYENTNLPNTSFSILTNSLDFTGDENYLFSNINPILIFYPAGLSIYTDRMGDVLNIPSHNVYVNNSNIGTIGGSDLINSNWNYAGVKGHFYYQNNQLFGLDDDTADSFMTGTDGLADISNYISNLSTNFNFRIKHINFPNQAANLNSVNLAYFLSYTSPCIPFDVTVTQDTVVCLGSSIQLSASGGTAYEWQPATGLSCTDCPNPIATLDSSQFYMVRIWNNDSCSVVRPVKINVRELPAFQSVNPVATACGTETGSVVVVANNATAKPLSYSLNGGVFETSSTFTGEFTELGAGTYTLTLQDAFGCQRDTVFNIASNNTTQAQFTANPQSGAAPLEVSFTNTSTNASNYEWFVTSGSTSTNQGSSLSSITFDTSGVYTVTLVAWQNSSACADTFSVQILVFDTLVLQIPNVFTPNNDGANDVFSIISNLPASYTFVLLNRWGTVVASKKSTFAPNVPELLWDGKNTTDGTYFYTLEVEWGNETKKVEGFVVKIAD